MPGQERSVDKKVILAAIVITVVLTSSALYYYPPFGTGSRSTSMKTPHQDTFVYQTPDDVDYLDPACDYEVAGGAVLELVYQRLLFYDRDRLEIVPELAEDFNVSSDGLTYTFHIRRGISFHDGTPLNASAVKFSLDRTVLMNDPDGPAWILAQVIKGGPEYMNANTWQNENEAEMKGYVQSYLAANGIQVVDEFTIRITLEYSFGAFPSMLTYGGPGAIVSPSFVLAHSGKGWWSNPEYAPFGLDRPGFHNKYLNENTCGTGPYKVVEWTKNTRIVLERNQRYWKNAPKITHVVFQQVTEAGTRLLAFFSGEADAIVLPAANIYDVIEKTPWVGKREILPSRKASLLRHMIY